MSPEIGDAVSKARVASFIDIPIALPPSFVGLMAITGRLQELERRQIASIDVLPIENVIVFSYAFP